MKKVLVFVLAVFFLVSSNAFALKVTGKSGTMLRSAPNGKKITKLDSGTDLEFTGKVQKKWIQVKTSDGKEGWVFAKNTDYTGSAKKMMKENEGKAMNRMESKGKDMKNEMKKEMMQPKEEMKGSEENEDTNTDVNTPTDEESDEDY